MYASSAHSHAAAAAAAPAQPAHSHAASSAAAPSSRQSLPLHTSTAPTDMAATHTSLLSKKRGRKAPILSAAEVSAHRAGWSRLVNIREFVSAHSTLQSRLRSACAVLDAQDSLPDLSVDDLRVDAPFDAIDRAITQEVERVASLLQAQAEADALELRNKKAAAHQQLHRQRELKRAQLEMERIPVHMRQHMQAHEAEAEAKQDGSQAISQTSEAPAAAAAASQSSDVMPTQPVDASQSSLTAASQPPLQPAPDTAMLQSPPLSRADLVPPRGAALALRQGQALPDDFGANVPLYRDLTQPLQSMMHKRASEIAKRHHADLNCMSPLLAEQDKLARLRDKPHPLPLTADDVILRIAIYHPLNYSKQQEFLVLGSQPLTALRDVILCQHDRLLDGPHMHSACMFIEGAFYNDLRQPRAISLADTVLQWVAQDARYTHPQLATYTQHDMHTSTFGQLSVRLGAHYLYQHQGSCAHTMIISELRMAHPTDEQNAHVYPMRVYQARTRRQMCGVCGVLPTAYVTYGDKLATASPFFYCEQCYRPLHYNTAGQLLYNDFQVFPYDQE